MPAPAAWQATRAAIGGGNVRSPCPWVPPRGAPTPTHTHTPPLLWPPSRKQGTNLCGLTLHPVAGIELLRRPPAVKLAPLNSVAAAATPSPLQCGGKESGVSPDVWLVHLSRASETARTPGVTNSPNQVTQPGSDDTQPGSGDSSPDLVTNSPHEVTQPGSGDTARIW